MLSEQSEVSVVAGQGAPECNLCPDSAGMRQSSCSMGQGGQIRSGIFVPSMLPSFKDREVPWWKCLGSKDREIEGLFNDSSIKYCV